MCAKIDLWRHTTMSSCGQGPSEMARNMDFFDATFDMDNGAAGALTVQNNTLRGVVGENTEGAMVKQVFFKNQDDRLVWQETITGACRNSQGGLPTLQSCPNHGYVFHVDEEVPNVASDPSGPLTLQPSSSFVGVTDVLVDRSSVAQVRSIHGAAVVCNGSEIQGYVRAKKDIDLRNSRVGYALSDQGSVQVSNSIVGAEGIHAMGSVTIAGTSSVAGPIKAGGLAAISLEQHRDGDEPAVFGQVSCSESASMAHVVVARLEMKRAREILLGPGAVVRQLKVTVPEASQVRVVVADDARIENMAVYRESASASGGEIQIQVESNTGFSTAVEFVGCTGRVTLQ